MFDYIYNLADYEQGSNLIHYAGMAAIVLSIAAIAAAPQYGILALIASVGFCWSTYFSRRKKIEPYVLSCSCLLEMLRAAEKNTEAEKSGNTGISGLSYDGRKAV